MPAPTPPRLHALTGLRFLAAAFVALHHFAYLSGVHPRVGVADFFLGLGYVSVNLFFVLSGFVLAWTYIGATGALTVDRRTFWVARFARIYPAYALALLLALPIFIELASTGGSPGPGAPSLDNPAVVAATAITTPLLIQDWFGLLAWNTVGWSLSVEAFFYITFPFLAVWLGRASRQSLIRAALVFSALPVVISSVLFWDQAVAGRSGSWYEIGTFTEAFFYASPLVHWPEFMLGAIAGRLFQLRWMAGRASSWQASADYVSVALVVALLVTLGQLPAPIFVAAMSPAFAWLIFALAHGRSKVAATLSTTTLVLLGNASYALYLFHATAIQTFLDWAALLRLEWLLTWPAFIACFAAIVACTIGAYVGFEEPMRQWIRGRLTGPKAIRDRSGVRLAGSSGR